MSGAGALPWIRPHHSISRHHSIYKKNHVTSIYSKYIIVHEMSATSTRWCGGKKEILERRKKM